MFTSRTPSWLPIGGMMGAMAGALVWLMMAFGANHKGLVTLPDAAGSTVEFYIDRDGQLSLAEVVRQPAGDWRVWSGKKSLHDEDGIALWARVTLRNPTDRVADAVLTEDDFFVDRFEVWVQSEAGAAGVAASATESGWTHWVSGEAVPVENRPLWGREMAFPLKVPAHGQVTVYMRVSDYFMSWLRLAWWPDKNDFHAWQSRQLLAEGIYFGALLALLGYNAMLWLRLRLADIGYYVLYLGAVAAFMFLARGRGVELGWHLASPGLEALISTVMALACAFLVQFARVFLDLKTRMPRADRITRWLWWVLGAVAVTAALSTWWPTVQSMQITVRAVGVTHIALLLLATLAWRAGVRQARFFLLSFGCFFAFSLPMVIIWLSGSNEIKHLGLFGMMIGSALEMMLLSLAVADRFAQAQREKAVAQENLLEETEQRRAIQEAYADELAVEVRERTKDLEAANADKDRMIAVIGHDLRSPLTSLMQTAEQLSGASDDTVALKKYAGDSAQVGRQTLLLIEDLVLWARLRAGLRSPPGRHDVRALVAPVIALYRAVAGQRGVDLAVEVPESLRLSTELVLAQTLLRNLVANALRFARTRVEVRATEVAGGVRLTVRDDGPGLPATVMAAFTKEFPEQANADSGLGLRLCVEISRALGAKLEVTFTSEGGTEFGFTLPL